jgi:SAM-dependent methyltransferase
MCHESCIDFGKANLKEEDVRDKSVIEVGSLNVNGSLRSIIEAFMPSSYIGVDLVGGAGVDQICKIENLINKFGRNRFDLVICTEVLEHVRNWEKAIHNLKQINKPNGVILITTRSRGKAYHGYPYDFWRYEIYDMKLIFSDFSIKILEEDPQSPGVFFLGRKPKDFIENNAEIKLYSILLNTRTSIAIASIYEFLRIRRIKYYFKHPLEIMGMFRRKK